jgi:hypothetical protein
MMSYASHAVRIPAHRRLWVRGRAAVSHDRKYVTLNMRPTNSRLRTLVTFPMVTEQTVGGFVGGGNLGGAAGAAAGGVAPRRDPCFMACRAETGGRTLIDSPATPLRDRCYSG